MTRPMKIARNIAIGVAALILVAVIASLLASQTDWFRGYVKQKIIASTEDSTGGRVEVGSFRFDARHLRAIVTDFVIHGREPADSAPLLRIGRVQLDIRLFTSIHHFLDVAYLGAEHPEANVIVLPDGSTNFPTPKQKPESKETPLETVVNLAVGNFELTNGLLTLASQKQELNIRGNNLRAQLFYNVLSQGYKGQLSFEPLYIVSGRNTPVNLAITLPVALERDRIDFQKARIKTAQSDILVDGSIENIRDPKISAHINGHLALAELQGAGNLPIAIDAAKVPSIVDLDANATVANDSIQVTGLRLGIGQSTMEASGTLKASNGRGALQFKSRLALGELGRLAKLTARPDGIVLLNGTAKLDTSNNYQVNGNIQASNLSFQQGRQRIANVNLYSAIELDSHSLDLKGLRLGAFGGEITGNASLEDFARYRLDANAHSLDIRSLAGAAGQKQLPYDGVIAGPIEAAGNLKAAGATSVTADARLSIAPGKNGIPVSGRLHVSYNGATNDVRVDNSYVVLPHSRLTVNGAVDKQLNLALTSTNLNDLLAATSLGSNPMVLNGGQASFTGTVTGSLSSPRIAGHLAANRFSVEGRAFDQFGADAAASSTGAVVGNMSLTRGAMQMQASASVGLRNWQPLSTQPVSANATIQNGDVADLLALVGRASSGYSGMLNANLFVTGTVGSPQGGAELLVTNGTIDGQPFDRMQAQVNLADRLVTVSNAFVESEAARINMTARFEHPRDSFVTGCLEGHIDSNQVDLAQLRELQKQRPNTAGVVQLNVSVSVNLSQVKSGGQQETEFLLTSVNADASLRGLRSEGETYGDLNATARTNGKTVRYDLTSNFAGSNIRVNGKTQLARDYPTNAEATLNNLPIQRVLALAHRTDIPAKGNLSGSAHFMGTAENPQGSGDLDLANAVLYDEPIDHVRARVTYLEKSIDMPQFQIVAGPSRIDINAHYDHAAGDFETGRLQFRVDNSRIDLARIKNLQVRRPGLAGAVQIVANGDADIRQAEPRLLIRDLDANVKATGLAAQGKNFGDLSVTANSAASKVNFTLDSNLADASIHGRGNVQLAAHYPVDAQLSFSNVAWTHLQGLVGSTGGEPPSFDATTEGQVTVRGPLMKTGELSGSLQLTHLEVISISRTPRTANTVLLQNQGAIAATLDRGVVRIASAHVSGPQTDLQATGTVPLGNQAMDVNLNGNLNLALLKNISQDITSSGSVALATTVRGTVTEPLMNGRMELHNGSFNYAAVPNGISNANGVLLFNGNSISISNLTAESGGGKVSLGGFAAMSGNVRFGLKANASNVRVLVDPGASIVVDATISLTGTTQASLMSGTATINRITYAPQTDIGAMLTRAAPTVQPATAPSPILENMKLDVRVRNSDTLAVQASLAENLQVNADLRVRGTTVRPSVLGRITVTEGKLVFFGSTYTANTGTIGFYNPVRIEPVLDLSLETQAKGVDVVLRVTGPVDNMKLSYTSDPPLQFQEIVSLLAAGTTPTSDPTLLANQPSRPPQSFQQMGESAIVSKALVDPVANRLQRVFGVSQLKIDPSFTSGSQLPQAQLTLQQKVADNITFTYVTALNHPNGQTIEVDVSLSPQWSATATRDYNGIFSINLLYKKQFR